MRWSLKMIPSGKVDLKFKQHFGNGPEWRCIRTKPSQKGKRLEMRADAAAKQSCTHMAQLPAPWCPHPSHCLCSPLRCPFWTPVAMAAQSPLYGRSAHQPLYSKKREITFILQAAFFLYAPHHDLRTTSDQHSDPTRFHHQRFCRISFNTA